MKTKSHAAHTQIELNRPIQKILLLKWRVSAPKSIIKHNSGTASYDNIPLLNLNIRRQFDNLLDSYLFEEFLDVGLNIQSAIQNISV